MAGKRINDPSIPSAALIKDTDTFYLIQDGLDFQITGAVLRAALAAANNPMTTPGDLIQGGAAGVPTRFAVGATGKFLSVGVDGLLSWVDRPGISSGEGLINPMTAQNDMIVGGTAGEAIRLAGGTAGQYLTVVAGILTWADLPAAQGELTNPMTQVGDMIMGGAAGVPTLLEKGTNGLTLKMVDDRPTWVIVGSARAVVTPVEAMIGNIDLTKDHDGKYMRVGTFTSSGLPYSVIYTVQAQTTSAFEPDAEITIEQSGDSPVVIVGATGVTINKQTVFTNRTRGNFAVVTLKRTDLNVWTLFGQLETP